MNDQYFRTEAAKWAEAYRQHGEKDLEDLLYMFAKEISRDTRHKAYDVVLAASRDVMNLNRTE